MAAIERTAYPRFPPALTATELQTLYAPTDEERDFIAAHTRGPAQHVTLLTLRKCHRNLGFSPRKHRHFSASCKRFCSFNCICPC